MLAPTIAPPTTANTTMPIAVAIAAVTSLLVRVQWT